jgi:Cys-tRNA(Pro) deacylase
MQRLTPADLQAFMKRQAVEGEILHLDAPTPTVEAAAQAVGVREEQIVKSILFLVNQEPLLVIASGTARVEQRRIAQVYGVGRKRVKLASAEDVLDTTGYAVGALPPFGHTQALATLIDRRVLEQDEVYAGGGAENALLRLAAAGILRVTKGKVVDLAGE